jgi:hypothetical protein
LAAEKLEAARAAWTGLGSFVSLRTTPSLFLRILAIILTIKTSL